MLLGLGTSLGDTPSRSEPDVRIETVRSDLAVAPCEADCAAAATWAYYGRLAYQTAVTATPLVAAEPDTDPLAVQRGELSSVQPVPDWRQLLNAYPDWNSELMARIVMCESGGRSEISAPDYDGLRNYGPFQIHGEPEALDPAYGAQRAHEKYLAAVEAGGSGYEPWRGSRGCWG